MTDVDKGSISPSTQRRIEEILEKNRISIRSIQRNRNFNESKEIKLDPSKISMSKTDPKGIIEYANKDFMDACGFEEYELMGQAHNIVRHPDMPRMIFKFMWQRLHQGKGLYAVVKNKTKKGDYYWVITQLTTKLDATGKIISHYAKRKAAPQEVIYRFDKLYKKLKSIEDNQSIEVAEKYFTGLLEENNMSYDEFVLYNIGADLKTIEAYFNKKQIKKRKGFFSFFRK
jgi:PAS domain S-box-containing protein